MSADSLTIGEARKIAEVYTNLRQQIERPPCSAERHSQPVDTDHPWKIGQAYHIRTVTHYWTGRLAAVTAQELVLEEAAWIADTGRFADFFTEGPNEVEPIDGPVIIGRGAIVDAQEWTIALPRSQK